MKALMVFYHDKMSKMYVFLAKNTLNGRKADYEYIPKAFVHKVMAEAWRNGNPEKIHWTDVQIREE